MPNNYTLYRSSFPSFDGSSKISGYMCMPNRRTPRSVVQIVSGAGKSFADYEALTEHLTGNGYVVCGHDHLSTGESRNEGDTEGYFGKLYGKKILIEDTKRMTALIRQNIEGLSVVMAGDGFGAVIAETLIAEGGSVADGYVLIDSLEASRFIKKLRRAAKRRSLFSGEKKRGEHITKMLNRRGKRTESGKSYNISSDLGRASLTYRGFYDILSIVCDLNKIGGTGYGKKDIPLLVISKGVNPKNSCKNTVNSTYENYISNHFTDVRMILPEETIYNELVFNSLSEWLNEHAF